LDDVLDVPVEILERAPQAEAHEDRQGGAPEAVARRVVAAVGGLVAVEVLGRDRRSPEDVLVAVVPPVEDAAGDRVVEGLGALGLAVLVEEADVRELDLAPEGLVLHGLGEAVAQDLDRLFDAAVVHLDPVLRRGAYALPVALLEATLGEGARLAKQAVVLVEAVADRASDVVGEGHGSDED